MAILYRTNVLYLISLASTVILIFPFLQKFLCLISIEIEWQLLWLKRFYFGVECPAHADSLPLNEGMEGSLRMFFILSVINQILIHSISKLPIQLSGSLLEFIQSSWFCHFKNKEKPMHHFRTHVNLSRTIICGM